MPITARALLVQTPDDMIDGLFECVLLVYPSTPDLRDKLRRAYSRSRKPLPSLAISASACGLVGAAGSQSCCERTRYGRNFRAASGTRVGIEQSELASPLLRRLPPVGPIPPPASRSLRVLRHLSGPDEAGDRARRACLSARALTTGSGRCRRATMPLGLARIARAGPLSNRGAAVRSPPSRHTARVPAGIPATRAGQRCRGALRPAIRRSRSGAPARSRRCALPTIRFRTSAVSSRGV